MPRLLVFVPWPKPPRFFHKTNLVWNDEIHELQPGDQVLIYTTAEQVITSARLFALFEHWRITTTAITQLTDESRVRSALTQLTVPTLLIPTDDPYQKMLAFVDQFLSGTSQASS